MDLAETAPVKKRARTQPLLECCIVFTHYRDDDTTRYHLELLRKLNPFPVVAVCNATTDCVDGAIDVDLLSKRWSSEDKWGSADSILYRWFLHGGVRAQRYLMLEWDTLATAPVKEFFGEQWDRDVVGTSVKLHETHPSGNGFASRCTCFRRRSVSTQPALSRSTDSCSRTVHSRLSLKPTRLPGSFAN